MLREALRLAAGTITLAAGGWVLRALHGAPAALVAHPASIRAVARRSPNYRDGVFVNIDPATFNVDREQLGMIAWEFVGGRGRSRPAAPIPLGAPGIFGGKPGRLPAARVGP